MKLRTATSSLAAASAAALALAALVGPPAGASAPERVTTLTNVYNNPNANYLSGATCLISLTSIPDFTLVPTITSTRSTSGETRPTTRVRVQSRLSSG